MVIDIEQGADMQLGMRDLYVIFSAVEDARSTALCAYSTTVRWSKTFA
jgi:hypothetical protein